jgi:hypothetical protein
MARIIKGRRWGREKGRKWEGEKVGRFVIYHLSLDIDQYKYQKQKQKRKNKIDAWSRIVIYHLSFIIGHLTNDS